MQGENILGILLDETYNLLYTNSVFGFVQCNRKLRSKTYLDGCVVHGVQIFIFLG